MRVLRRRVQKQHKRKLSPTRRKRRSRSARQKSDCKERRRFRKRQLDALSSPTKKLPKQRRQLKTQNVPSRPRRKNWNHCFNPETSSGRRACNATTSISLHSLQAKSHPRAHALVAWSNTNRVYRAAPTPSSLLPVAATDRCELTADHH